MKTRATTYDQVDSDDVSPFSAVTAVTTVLAAMAGGHMKYRHLSRKSSHRQALLRNLVTSLVKNEAIHTTWHKAKEAQRLAEKLITLAKRDNEETRRKAQAILYVCCPFIRAPLER